MAFGLLVFSIVHWFVNIWVWANGVGSPVGVSNGYLYAFLLEEGEF